MRELLVEPERRPDRALHHRDVSKAVSAAYGITQMARELVLQPGVGGKKRHAIAPRAGTQSRDQSRRFDLVIDGGNRIEIAQRTKGA